MRCYAVYSPWWLAPQWQGREILSVQSLGPVGGWGRLSQKAGLTHPRCRVVQHDLSCNVPKDR
jgi:hypothetical protein